MDREFSSPQPKNKVSPISDERFGCMLMINIEPPQRKYLVRAEGKLWVRSLAPHPAVIDGRLRPVLLGCVHRDLHQQPIADVMVEASR
jgi:hypothetical protein